MTIPMLDSLRGLALGISIRADLRIEVALETADAKIGRKTWLAQCAGRKSRCPTWAQRSRATSRDLPRTSGSRCWG